MGPPKFKGQSLVVTLLHIRLPIVWLWPLNTFAAPHFFLSLLTVYTGTATYNGVSVSSSSRELPPGHAIFSSVESNHSTLKRHSAQARNSWWAEWGDHGSESRFPNKVSHIFHSSESSKNGLVGEKMDYMGHWKSLSGQVIQRWGFQKKTPKNDASLLCHQWVQLRPFISWNKRSYSIFYRTLRQFGSVSTFKLQTS